MTIAPSLWRVARSCAAAVNASRRTIGSTKRERRLMKPPWCRTNRTTRYVIGEPTGGSFPTDGSGVRRLARKKRAPQGARFPWTDLMLDDYWVWTPSGYCTNVPSEKMMSQSKTAVVIGCVVEVVLAVLSVLSAPNDLKAYDCAVRPTWNFEPQPS